MDERENHFGSPTTEPALSPLSESSRSLLPPIAAALAAALVGGVLWGLIRHGP
ncbi:MAG: hypothetical protein WKF41_08820 [Gaiellaceae bacterium]